MVFSGIKFRANQAMMIFEIVLNENRMLPNLVFKRAIFSVESNMKIMLMMMMMMMMMKGKVPGLYDSNFDFKIEFRIHCVFFLIGIRI